MAEKKRFFIPKNYDKKFEFIPGISGWQHVAFIPVVAVSYVTLLHLDFSFSNKIILIALTAGIPYILISTKPVRQNVSLYKHLWWKLKFLSRQRTFKYRKVGYDTNVQISKQAKKRELTKGIKGSTTSEENNTGLNTNERSSGRNVDHKGKSGDPVPESISS